MLGKFLSIHSLGGSSCVGEDRVSAASGDEMVDEDASEFSGGILVSEIVGAGVCDEGMMLLRRLLRRPRRMRSRSDLRSCDNRARTSEGGGRRIS